MKSSEIAHTFPATAASPITSLDFSENGTWLAAANEGSTIVTIFNLRTLAVLKSIDIGTPVTGVQWDYTGLFLAACGAGGVIVSQYSKGNKTWSEPLRKGISAVDVKWGAQAKSLVALAGDGNVNVLA